MSDQGHKARLLDIGHMPDDAMPLVETLLLIGGADLSDYNAHIHELHDALASEIIGHPFTEEGSILNWRLDRLNAVLRGRFGYHGDHEGYDVPENINMATVIDRRCGIPVALGVLYMELAKKQDWPIYGLNFPGHFFLRLDQGAHRLIFDPFESGAEMNAVDLRATLKKILGARAELHHDYYNTVSQRDIALRFCNNRKTRLISAGSYQEALDITEQELWFAPDEPRLYYDAGVLSTKVDHVRDAIHYLEEFIQRSHDVRTVSEAHEMIRGLQRLLQ
jgi:regulator of sirC expression with transglutaminase-like and TPR domain